jgi:DNA-binding CsgD family transcriptional regulator
MVELSERETQVLLAVANGLTNDEIAETLGLSAHTIATYRTRILIKTDSRNFPQAVAKWIRAHEVEAALAGDDDERES